MNDPEQVQSADLAAGHDRVRRRAAKLLNERLKLAATFFNNLGVAGFIATALAPFVAGTSGDPGWTLAIGFAFMLVLHVLGQVVLSLWKSEE